jgi:dihydroneopterin aldolase
MVMGKIIITGLEVFAYHGCTPEEKERGQDFLIDLEVEYDLSPAIAEDDLGRAVDYDGLASAVHELASEERYDLLESLASRIGEHILDSTPAERVLVRVHKPDAPMQREVEDVAVEMVFIKDG